jgi:cyclopropane-fatty-acyl-phospholipid synthase
MTAETIDARGGVARTVRESLGTVGGEQLERLPFTVRFWDGSSLPASEAAGAARKHDGGAPTVVLRDPLALAHVLHEPNQVGLARAWVSGVLEADDLEAVLALRERFRGLTLTLGDRARLLMAAIRVGGARLLSRPPVPAIEARVSGRRRSLARDRASVRHHYDVSNRFYNLVLGPSLVYSCAYFASPQDTLEAAQAQKLELICRKLRLEPGERLLDIGCGWGSLVMHAAAHHGVEAVGVTLSTSQAELARERIAAAGLSRRASVRVGDYRELSDGPYDKVASVGMYEHVGRSELPTYARTVRALLRPGGLFLNHGIARLRSRTPAGDTFITRYVFPDGELHPLADLMLALHSAGFETRDVEALREHYVLTLRRWLGNLDRHREEILREVGGERERAWQLYMLGSASAFESGEITVYQVLAARDGAPHGLPLRRTWLMAGARAQAGAHEPGEEGEPTGVPGVAGPPPPCSRTPTRA